MFVRCVSVLRVLFSCKPRQLWSDSVHCHSTGYKEWSYLARGHRLDTRSGRTSPVAIDWIQGVVVPRPWPSTGYKEWSYLARGHRLDTRSGRTSPVAIDWIQGVVVPRPWPSTGYNGWSHLGQVRRHIIGACRWLPNYAMHINALSI